jgi:hypothetical protein
MSRKAELVQAIRHCKEGAARIARQEALLEELRRDHHPTEQAEALLVTFKTTLACMKAHRDLIVAEIAAGEK